MKIIVMWKFHVDESAEGRYNMILGRDLLTALGLDLNFSENIIIVSDKLYERSSATMVDLGNYDYKYLT